MNPDLQRLRRGPTGRCGDGGLGSGSHTPLFRVRRLLCALKPRRLGARASSEAGDSPRLVRRARPWVAGVAAPPQERRAWPGVFEAQSRPPPSQDYSTSAEATPAARELVPRRRVSGAERRDWGAQRRDWGAHGLAGG